MADFADTSARSRSATIGWEEEVWMMGNFDHGADTARILIVDRSELFRRGLRDALADTGGFAVVGEVDRTEDAASAYRQVRPGVALLADDDADSALRALQGIRETDSDARVIIFVAHDAMSSELDPQVLAMLSRREGEVLRALALGYGNKQIGVELGVSVGTVKTHLRHIFRKLRVSDRTGAVLKALDAEVRRAA
jgi:DNA-binding NarL/FixJ family response regulator